MTTVLEGRVRIQGGMYDTKKEVKCNDSSIEFQTSCKKKEKAALNSSSCAVISQQQRRLREMAIIQLGYYERVGYGLFNEEKKQDAVLHHLLKGRY